MAISIHEITFTCLRQIHRFTEMARNANNCKDMRRNIRREPKLWAHSNHWMITGLYSLVGASPILALVISKYPCLSLSFPAQKHTIPMMSHPLSQDTIVAYATSRYELLQAASPRPEKHGSFAPSAFGNGVQKSTILSG